MAKSADLIEIFTDGACSGNPGPGGWGVVLRWRDHEKELYGGVAETTNNRMELMAAIRGIETLKPGSRAVLVTDSGGSTAMTQERGDDAAQLVVRLHDVIVRDALTQHGDREIKHIGDGIMARFLTIASAVDGAIDMQRACERANADDAELGLGLCIGINAGEPIHENGDLFGTPVQIAARVLGEAESDEIAVSKLVREICVGKHYGFAKKGDFELKGIAEPTPIYPVDWHRDADAADQNSRPDGAPVSD